MTDSTENGHAIAPVTPPIATARAAQPLSSLDELAFRRFVTGEPAAWADFLAEINQWANDLADPAGQDDVRRQLLARMIASHRAKALVLEATRDECLKRRSFEDVFVLERLLDGTMRRLTTLLAEHRHASAAGQRSVNVTAVAVGGASQVNVVAGAGGLR